MPNIDYYDSIQPLSKDKKWLRAEHLLIESLAMLIFSFLEHAIVSSTMQPWYIPQCMDALIILLLDNIFQ